jgi:adenylosuccinate synthase
MVDVILGLQWGDEGKGKIVDYFAKHYEVIARFQGGPNAGHTLYIGDKKVVLHQIPSGIFHTGKINIIGNGVVLDVATLKKECETVVSFGVDVRENLYISEKTQLIIPTHRALDKASELSKGNDKIGSTLKGIGPAYMDKTGRNGLRVGDLLSPNFLEKYKKLKEKHQKMLDGYGFTEDISEMETAFFDAIEYVKKLKIVNGEYFINDLIKQGKKVLAEGAQGTMLDIDFGTYPFVTSSNTITSGVCNGLGIAPQWIKEVYGITKAYCTRVGGGPFPTELLDEKGEQLRKIGNEFGATTGRPRRCGWIDLVALKYTCMLNGVTQLIMTKTDVLDSFTQLSAGTAYLINGEQHNQMPYDINNTELTPVYHHAKGWNTDLNTVKSKEQIPTALLEYIDFINHYLGVHVAYISNGPGREQIVPL